jgi:hypothetical protein
MIKGQIIQRKGLSPEDPLRFDRCIQCRDGPSHCGWAHRYGCPAEDLRDWRTYGYCGWISTVFNFRGATHKSNNSHVGGSKNGRESLEVST